MSVTVKAAGEPPHYCETPGLWRRWRLGLNLGAVVVCDVCGVHWQWCSDPMFGPDWVRLPDEGTSA